jgi:hypothetical protein
MLIIKATTTMHPNNYQTDGDAKVKILAFEGGSTGNSVVF